MSAPADFVQFKKCICITLSYKNSIKKNGKWKTKRQILLHHITNNFLLIYFTYLKLYCILHVLRVLSPLLENFLAQLHFKRPVCSKEPSSDFGSREFLLQLHDKMCLNTSNVTEINIIREEEMLIQKRVFLENINMKIAFI